MTVLTFIILLIVAPIILITSFFALEVLLGLRSLSRTSFASPPGRTTILVPAHNEEAVIGDTVSNLIREGGQGVAVLVVADNCSDGTAQAARAAGAQVEVRSDLERRGKGFALAAGRELMRRNPPDLVLVVDADCRIDRSSLAALVRTANTSARPCQAVYLLAPDLGGSPMVQISNFAFMIKNLVRQRGLQRLAGRVHLTGTGMAFPWRIFDESDLGGSNIVEDLALGLELADRNLPPLLVEDATIWSLPASAGATLTQRQRWEGGFLATAFKMAPAAFGRSIRRADVRGVLAALDLSVPPLALLVMLNGVGLALGIAGVLLGAAAWPVIAQLTIGMIAFLALATAWGMEGRRFASASSLARLPLYLVWKLPLYLGLARHGAPKNWLKTGR